MMASVGEKNRRFAASVVEETRLFVASFAEETRRFAAAVWARELKALLVLGCQLALFATTGLIAYAQLQPSFSVRYHYTYKVKLDGSEIKEETNQGSDTYDMWSGCVELYDKSAYFLAVLIVLWSGVLPYVKIMVTSYYLWTVAWLGRPPFPYSGAWFAVGRLALFDIMIVAAAAAFLRYEVKDYSYKKTVDDLFTLKIQMWVYLAATARQGVYWYFTSIVLTQALGAATVYLGRAFGTVGVGGLLPPLQRKAFALPVPLTAVSDLVGASAAVLVAGLLIHASYVTAYLLIFKFEDSGTKDNVSYDLSKRVEYHKTTEQALGELDHTLYVWGSSNAPLYHIAVALALVMPVLRLFLRVSSAVAPVPGKWVGVLRRLSEFADLFCAADLWFVASGVTMVQV